MNTQRKEGIARIRIIDTNTGAAINVTEAQALLLQTVECLSEEDISCCSKFILALKQAGRRIDGQ